MIPSVAFVLYRRATDAQATRQALVAVVAVWVSAFVAHAQPAAAQSWFPWDDRSSYRRDRFDYGDMRRERRLRSPSRYDVDPYARERAPVPRARPVTAAAVTSKVTQSPALLAVISLSSQRLTLYNASGEVMTAPISSGMAGHRTPTGIFSVIQKNRFHASNIYSGAPMPFMQRITWSGIAMHAGRLPGYPASHGCIRLPYDTAADLFAATRMGMRVIVSPSDVRPKPFTHPALPVPRMTPAAAPSAAIAEASPGSALARVQQASAASASTADTAVTVETRLETPVQRAAAVRARAMAVVAEAVAAGKVAVEAEKRVNRAAEQATADSRAAAADLRRAEDEASVVSAVAVPEAAAIDAAEARATAARTRLTALEAIEAERAKDLYAATMVVSDAQDSIERARAAAKLTDRTLEPISVFVSAKEAKVFVRQGFQPVFDAPATIKDTAPLGTHLFVALSADAVTGGLAWTAASVPESTASFADQDEPSPRRGRKAAPATVGRASTPAEALERIELAPETRAWIAERIWLGGSLIISDAGLGTETGKGTDFIVQTK